MQPSLDEVRSTCLTGKLPTDYPTLDHLLHRSRGGTWNLENLVVACPPCNNHRGGPPSPPGSRRVKKKEYGLAADIRRVREDGAQEVYDIRSRAKPDAQFTDFDRLHLWPVEVGGTGAG